MKLLITSILLTLSLMHTNDLSAQTKHKKYQLLLPSQDSTVSFIVHKKHLGIYDNLNNKELLLKEQIDAIKITEINIYMSYADILIQADNGGLTISETYIISKARDESNQIAIRKKGSEKRKNQGYWGYYYENDIRLLDNDKVIHNLSLVEPSLIHNGLKIIQKSGVYSLKEQRFVIPQKHTRIEAIRSPSYDQKSPFFFKTLAIAEDDYLISLTDFIDDEEGFLYPLPNNNFRYSLYGPDLQGIINSSVEDIKPMRFGGFARAYELYDTKGKKLPAGDTHEINGWDDPFISKNHIIIGYLEEYSDDAKNIYSFYDKEGKSVESQFIKIDKFLQLPDKALGITERYNEDFSIPYYGVFDFDDNSMVISDTYDEIKVVKNGTDFYFSCKKEGKVTYFNKKFKEFKF